MPLSTMDKFTANAWQGGSDSYRQNVRSGSIAAVLNAWRDFRFTLKNGPEPTTVFAPMQRPVAVLLDADQGKTQAKA